MKLPQWLWPWGAREPAPPTTRLERRALEEELAWLNARRRRGGLNPTETAWVMGAEFALAWILDPGTQPPQNGLRLMHPEAPEPPGIRHAPR